MDTIFFWMILKLNRNRYVAFPIHWQSQISQPPKRPSNGMQRVWKMDGILNTVQLDLFRVLAPSFRLQQIHTP